jgi:hypothetical protein
MLSVDRVYVTAPLHMFASFLLFLLGRKRGAEQERVLRADAPVSPRAQIGAVPLEDLVRVRHVRGRLLLVSNVIKLFFAVNYGF